MGLLGLCLTSTTCNFVAANSTASMRVCTFLNHLQVELLPRPPLTTAHAVFYILETLALNSASIFSKNCLEVHVWPVYLLRNILHIQSYPLDTVLTPWPGVSIKAWPVLPSI